MLILCNVFARPLPQLPLHPLLLHQRRLLQQPALLLQRNSWSLLEGLI